MGTFANRTTPSEGDLERVFALFPVLKDRLHDLGGTLSGGEQQMLALGRALVSGPRLLLMDEPSMGLAPNLVAKIFDLIQEINRQGVSILLVEQNARKALQIADRAYVLETGAVRMQGTSAAMLEHPEIRAAYLGG
jgi:branched-chain amino acid transport system ATP-binding protein